MISNVLAIVKAFDLLTMDGFWLTVAGHPKEAQIVREANLVAMGACP